MKPGRDLAFALDPVAWSCSLGFEPDPWQADVLRSTATRLLMNCSRQSGKSTVAALLALHRAVYHRSSLVLLMSPSLRQSSELFKKVAAFYRLIGENVPATAESALRLELENGSRIVSLPGREQTVRGYSGVSLLIVDEAARVEDDLYRACRPMLAVSGGRLLLMSTPFGKRGFFFEEWEQGGRDWERIEIPADQCPRITAEFLAEEREHLGEWWYRQEYECDFMESVSAAFSWEAVQAATVEEVTPWDL